MTDHPPAVQAALDKLGDAFEALDSWSRITIARATLNQLQRDDLTPEARPVMVSLHRLTQGADSDNLDHLVSVLEVAGPNTRTAIRMLSGGHHPVWTSLRKLCDAIGAATVNPTKGTQP
jgi:hypothetical protein